MTDTAATLPQPAPALEQRFNTILREHMQDVPLVNPALQVQAVGFVPWREFWLGVLVTPWFMNLMLLPREPAAWQPVPERESRHLVFPAGVFEFISARDAALGNYLACSLFSPMFDFADPVAAHDTAVAALAALFDASHRAAATPEAQPSIALPPATPAAEREPEPADAALSKRAFLFGPQSRAPHGP
jgi:[NiFe] hydrogenase assembly HybE family chaperone